MTLRTGTSSTGRIYKYYTCAGQARVGKSKCPGISIPMDRLDHAVTRAITDHVLSAERLGDLLSELGRKLEQEKGQVASRIESLGKVAEDADAKLRNLYQALAKGILDPDEPSLKGELDELRKKRDTAREAIRRLDAAPAELSFGEDVLAQFADLMRNKISEGEISLRKRYLKTLIGARGRRRKDDPNRGRAFGPGSVAGRPAFRVRRSQMCSEVAHPTRFELVTFAFGAELGTNIWVDHHHILPHFVRKLNTRLLADSVLTDTPVSCTPAVQEPTVLHP